MPYIYLLNKIDQISVEVIIRDTAARMYVSSVCCNDKFNH